MKYNFDEIIDRTGSNSIKHDFITEFGKPAEALPLWVADMDFKVAPEITQSLAIAMEHGIYGYSDSKKEYYNAVQNWFKVRFQWDTEKEWIVRTPGVVFAIATAVRTVTKEGDAVLIQQPVYYPFSATVKLNNRVLVNNPLVFEDGTYHIDFVDFEDKIIKNQVKLFILCSPHNPVGRVWTRQELTQIGDICIKHGVIILSDEIHADFIYPGFEHSIFASIKPEFAENTILCTAPSKTFNLAGLQASNIFIPNKELRGLFAEEISKQGYHGLNMMGLIACQAAYEHGAPWLEELKEYLIGNLKFIRSFLLEHLPQIKLIEPQGTYLLWMDFRELGLEEAELEKLILHKAKLWLDAGTMFGSEGKGFQRVNIACPREILRKAMLQLEEAVKCNGNN